MIGKQFSSLRLPDILTLAGLLSSFAAILLLSWGTSYALPAYFCIIGQIVADFLDGRLARKMNLVPSLGIHLDNFSDFLTIFATLSLGRAITGDSLPALFIFAFFLLAGAVRLAYFTVNNAGNPSFFLGIPTTATSFSLSTLTVLDHLFWHLPAEVLLGLYLLGGIGMISSLRIPKL